MARWDADVLAASSQKPSWRKGASGRSPSGRNAPNWMEHLPGPSWEGAASRIAALVLLALGVGALLLAWVWQFPDRAPARMLVLAVTGYDAPCPPNAFAAEDAQNFEQAYRDYDNVRAEIAESPQTSAELLQAVEGFLATARPGGPDKNVVLIYLSALGAVNDSGLPCLVLPKHDALDASSWLPVAELFEALAAPERLRDCHKILLLDAHRMEDAWRMGIVANTFSLAIERLIAETPPRNCVVLSAATGLEPSLAAPEMSATVFGYYAASGLRGAADEAGDGDEIVTLGELEQYLRDQVDRWATVRRGVHQQPRVLCGGPPDLKLADVTGRAQLPQKPWKAVIGPKQFRDAFIRLRQCEQKQALALDPVNWAKAQFLLERLDAESIAGSEYRNAAEVTFVELTSTLNQLEEVRTFPELEAASLAVHQQLVGGEADESLEPAWTAWLKEPDKAEVPQDYDRAASFVWSRLIEGNEPLTQAALSQGLAFCAKAGQPGRNERSEIAFLRLLMRHVDWGSPPMADAPLSRLLAARHESELLAAGPDPRPQYAFGRQLAPLDESLATAFDDVLVGDDASLHLAAGRLDALLSDGSVGYGQVAAAADRVLQAIQVRDEALASALYWNQWLVRRAKYEPGYRKGLDAQEVARGGIELSQCLENLMRASSAGAAAADERKLPGLTDNLQNSVTQLVQAYAERIAEITHQEQGSAATTSVETPDLLGCPLGFSEGRERLHEEWIKKITQAAGPARTGKSISDNQIENQADLAYLRWVVAEGTKPLGELLEAKSLHAADEKKADQPWPPEEASNASREELVAALAELGGRLRHQLNDMPDECRKLRAETEAQFADRPAREARLGLSRADALTRAMAPLISDRQWFAGDAAPAALLRTLDAQAWLAWQGNRAVDDCWGSWDADPASATPYFQTLAAHVADDAERILPESTHDVTELRKRIEKTAEMIDNWRPLAAEDLAVADTGEKYVNHTIAYTGEPRCAPGFIAVYLTDGNGELRPTYDARAFEVRRRRVGAHDPASKLENQLEPEELEAYPVLHANALFRGHVWQTRFSIGQGSSVVWQKPAPAPASVIVKGESTQVTQVIFIVDCSGSMDDDGWDRLKVGVEALHTILDHLVEREERFRVGLIFYGRRAGWTKGSAKPVYAKNTFRGNPGDDIEPAYPLTMLRRDDLLSLKKLLRDAAPHGETPLYGSLVEALNQFDWGSPGPCHLIAITDGVNDVHDGQTVLHRWRYNEVIGELATRSPRVRLDIIEFGGKQEYKDATEKQKWTTGRDDLREIVNSMKPAGSFRQVRDAKVLIQMLEDSLRLDRYRLQVVANGGGPDDATPWAELGAATPLPAPTAPTDFRVYLQTHQPKPAEVVVEGGEALEIRYRRPPENSLVHPLHEDDDYRERKTVGGFQAASLVPSWKLGAPVFQVSIQRVDESQFTRRPEIVWAKVEPLESGAPRPYFYFDREFVPDVPVPMLSLRAEDWPGGSLARVEVAFVMNAASLTPEVMEIPRLAEGEFEHRRVHEAELRVKSELLDQNSLEVVVIEQHDPSSKDYPLHVQLDPPPDSLNRTFFAGDRSVHHVFRYEGRPSDPKLRVLTRREIENAGVGVQFERVELPRR